MTDIVAKNREYHRRYREKNRETYNALQRVKMNERNKNITQEQKDKKALYMREYRLKKKAEAGVVKEKPPVQPPPVIQQPPPKQDEPVVRRSDRIKDKTPKDNDKVVEIIPNKTKKTNKKIQNKTMEKIDTPPLYIQNKDSELKEQTIDTYISKLNIIHNISTNHSMSSELKREIEKVFKLKPYNGDFLQNELHYMYQNMEDLILYLREKFVNKNTRNSYYIALTAFSSRVAKLKEQYLILTKLSTDLNKEYQNERDEQIMNEADAKIIINLMDKDKMKERINNEKDLKKKLLLMIFNENVRRMSDIRLLKISKTELNTNTLLMSNVFMPIKFIFKEYKTDKTFGKQEENISDNMKQVIKEYIIEYGKKQGDYLFSLNRNNKEGISLGNFSNMLKDLGLPNILVRQAQSKAINDDKSLSLSQKKNMAIQKGQHMFNTSNQYNKSFVKMNDGKIISFEEYKKILDNI